jgi:23S rRNA (uridine2552-2'-O)-methyltransferase
VKDVRTVTADELGGSHAFEVVLSDMAPATIGHRDTDMARSYELFMVALDLALRVLAPGGAFVGKIFQGGEFQHAHAELKRNFKTVKVVRPKATREMSYEVFLVGQGRKGEAPESEPTEPEPTEPRQSP